jgi:RNA polymerase sigma factor (sigma-70 family)
MKPCFNLFVLGVYEKRGDRTLRNAEGSESGPPKDREAWFEEIMDEYGERLTKLAYNYVKDWRLAEDIVQDVFITCYTYYEKLDQIVSFKAWIYRITINRSKDTLKSTSFKKVFAHSKLFKLFASKELSPEMAVVKQCEKEFISHCVLALPVKYREIIILYYYEELPIERISEILKMNENTIKTRLMRAREKIKKMMERSGDYGG